MLYEAREHVINLFKDYVKIVSGCNFKATYKTGMKTPKQEFQRWPIDVGQVKTGNTSDNLPNKIG